MDDLQITSSITNTYTPHCLPGSVNGSRGVTKLLAHWSDSLPATEATGTLDYFRATEGGW